MSGVDFVLSFMQCWSRCHKLWSWVKQFGEVSGKVMVALFGTLGLMKGFLWLIVYVPKKTLVILSSFGKSISKAWVELLVWINPKR